MGMRYAIYVKSHQTMTRGMWLFICTLDALRRYGAGYLMLVEEQILLKKPVAEQFVHLALHFVQGENRRQTDFK